MPLRLLQLTPRSPGAIAIIQVMDDDFESLTGMLHELTGISQWPVGRMRLAKIADIDEGLIGRLSPSTVHLMPHGGLRVVQRLISWLMEHGGVVSDRDESSTDRELFPESNDSHEAAMLKRLSRAASPLAIDLLLDQPSRWREFISAGKKPIPDDFERSRRLDRLLDPPLVVLTGQPNVGKSTLSNALLGREMSIMLDEPGTTRDYTVGLIDMAGLVVNWHDTPGLRDTADSVEARAIDVAQRLIDRADLLVAMRDPTADWPKLPRPADLWVLNKADTLLTKPNSVPTGADATHPVLVSAKTGLGLAELVQSVRERLVPCDDLVHPNPWLFGEAEIA